MPQQDLDTILEAATWAPSAYNAQPWRFVYAHRDTEHWDRLLSLLVDFNQTWASHASVLIFVVSKKTSGEMAQPNHSHSFDAGAAWAMMALQATHMGYHTHGMTGVHFDKAAETLGIPEGYRLEAAAVIGRQGSADHLPEAMQTSEKPTGRDPVVDVAYEGMFAQG
jgi:nitroreductase